MDEQPRSVKDLLVEAKDVSDLMVDLAYAAVFFDEEKLAREVERLRDRMYDTNRRLRTMAVLADPSGAVIGAWQPGAHRGFGVINEPNAPAWFELHTRDHRAAVDFYTTVFGWDAHTAADTDDFRYTTLGEGDEALAGVMDARNFLPEGVPSHWTVYFAVDDADATLERIVALGGAVVMPAEDTPYGRLAVAADPTGAQFRLLAR